MIKVAVFGQPFWVERIVDSLGRHPRFRIRAFSASSFQPSATRALGADILLRVGFRPGARTVRGRIFDLAWATLRAMNPKAVPVHYWIGTDVMNSVEDYRTGALTGAFFRSIADWHITASDWLTAELDEVGIRASTVYLPISLGFAPIPPTLPQEFSVLTYIPDWRPEFYGSREIEIAASMMPEVQFHVVAGKGGWTRSGVENITFHGWQRDMGPRFRDATVVLRLTRHDGLPAMIREGLACARHVVFSYRHPFTSFVEFGDSVSLVERLEALRALHHSGKLLPNFEGKQFAEVNYSEEATSRRLSEYLALVAS